MSTRQYFEVPRPPGDGLCSDNDCPCPEVKIPSGTGYLYVSQSAVDYRRDALSLEEAKRKKERLALKMESFITFTPGTVTAIIMCEQGAKLRGLDLKVAAADARHWWKTGLVPLRATPIIR